MKVRLDQIPPSGRTYELEIGPDVLERELGLEEDDGTRWTSKATGSVTLEPGHKALAIRGTTTFRFRQGCARCLAPVDRGQNASFRLTKLLRPPPPPASKEVELDRTSIDEDYLTDEEIDLEGVLLEQIALEIPARVLCSEECRGLCPVCGVNRNEESCHCEQGAVDPRFAVLAQLRDTVKDPEGRDEG